jgi:CxxC motif-containing protein (DUF1111 family)
MIPRPTRSTLLTTLLLASGFVLAQAQGVVPTMPQFGDPLPGLSESERAAFDAGAEEFRNIETPESGLGPIFNNVSCAACHTQPAIGGSSAVFVTRFGRMVNGMFDPMEDKGGSLLQQFSIDQAVRETIPPEANVVARRMTTPLFGAGLVEAIPDEAILQNARRRKPDGITGRASMVTDAASGMTRVGRFGWKAQQATLLSFAGDAYLNEMGITSRFFPKENAPNGNQALLALFDRFADPEDQVDPATNKGDIDLAADFMRLLAPPPAVALSTSASAGQVLFAQSGCAECHQPTMQSGRSAIAALDRKPVALYSDLLLHDMGSLGDGIGQGSAGPREMRTAPLWGLRARRPYLHDGRADSIASAILAHDGEGAVARDRYSRLTPEQRRQIADFLASL